MKNFFKTFLMIAAFTMVISNFALAASCELFTKDGQHFFMSNSVRIPTSNAQGRVFKISSMELLVIPALRDTQVLFAEESGSYGMTGRITVISEGKVLAEVTSDGDIDAVPHPYLTTRIQDSDLKCSN